MANQTISQRKKDVDDAKAGGAGYVEQVKGHAQGAIDTAKVINYFLTRRVGNGS